MSRERASINGRNTVKVTATQHYGNNETTIIAKLWYTINKSGVYAEITKGQIDAAKKRIGLPDGDYLDYCAEDSNDTDNAIVDHVEINTPRPDGSIIARVTTRQ
jgi:hypothetical protein